MSTYPDPRALPIVGPWLARVGMVNNIMHVPCATTPQLWVEGMFQSLPRLFWELYKPDPLDTYVERFGAGHRRRRKAKWRRAKKILPKVTFDFAPLESIEGKVKIPGVLFEVNAWAQRLAWYMMIVDAGTEYALNWTSTVYKAAGCLTNPTAYCRGYNPAALYVTSVGDWRPLNFASHEGEPWISANIVTVPAGSVVNVGIMLQFNGNPPLVVGPTASISVKIVDQKTGLNVDSFVDYRLNDAATPTARVLMTKYVPFLIGDTSLSLWVKADNNYADLTGTECSITLGDLASQGLTFDP